MLKFKNVNTRVPSLTRFYCKPNKRGDLSLQTSADEETIKYFNQLTEEDEEIKNLKIKLDKDYSDALNKDADLKAFIDKLNSQQP
jgi:hypothetical protein